MAVRFSAKTLDVYLKIVLLLLNIKLSYWRHGMSTLAESKPKVRKAYVPTTALAKVIEFDNEMMNVSLIDGRIISVPIIGFPLLYEASSEQRQNYEIGGGGISLHWEELDEDLSVANLIAGVDWRSI
jgi:hypothetical protein